MPKKEFPSRAPVLYPKRVFLTPNQKATCENNDILGMRRPSFYIEKPRNTEWIALLDLKTQPKTPLAKLDAAQGVCDSLETFLGNRRCGMGRAMMELCLTDKYVIIDGGFDPLDDDFEDKELKEPARNFCETIVVINCATKDDTDPIVCKTYMEAAITSGYHMIFVDGLEEGEVGRFKRYTIESAKSLFISNPVGFLEEKGMGWFFCKCKPNKRRDCLGNILFYFRLLFLYYLYKSKNEH